MTDQVTEPNPSDAPADTPATGEDTALAEAAKADDAPADDPKDDDAPVDDKPADQDKPDDAPEGAPDAYDTAAWTMPEGVEFDTEGFSAVEPALRELNLTNDQAGKLMTTYAEKIVPLIQQRTVKAMDDNAAELRANLARDLQADPEVGGKKLDESRSFAAKAIAHFIPDKDQRNEFSTFLNESGLGNHPLLMRLVTGAGRAISEATTPSAETAKQPLSDAQLFYGKGGN